ncbi:helix-turn-helix domain-containing protein [Avibacterium paragallinarum]|nr:transcriptional regulator [Avibacterium paragallinarum]RZN75622.1 helix-turn-helix domain-containing protein [Avibacterium paragallinarum]
MGACVMITRKNVSKVGATISTTERNNVRNRIIKALLLGKMTQGQALRKLRIEMLGVNQQQYMKMVKVSRQTLSNIENDKGNYSVETINQVFKPFGFELGLVPISKELLTEIMQ